MLFVEGAPLEGGGRGHHQNRPAKGVILACAILTITREDAPGPVVRAILPQGPHALAARSAATMKRVGGWVSPPGDSLCGGGGSEGGVQGGKPSRGRRGAPFAETAMAVRTGGWVTQ